MRQHYKPKNIINMGTIKKTIVAIMVCVSLLLLVAESDSFNTFVLTKVCAIIFGLLSIQTYIWFGLNKDEKINKFLNED